MSTELTTHDEYTLATFKTAVAKPSVRQWQTNHARIQTRLDSLEKEYYAKQGLLQQEKSDILAPVYEECVRGINKEFRAAFYRDWENAKFKPAYVRNCSDRGANYWETLEFDGKRYLYNESQYISEGNIILPE